MKNKRPFKVGKKTSTERSDNRSVADIESIRFFKALKPTTTKARLRLLSRWSSSAAGAIADSGLFRESVRLELSIERFLDENNSSDFFQAVGGLLQTGPTGTNVMDITLLIIDKEDL